MADWNVEDYSPRAGTAGVIYPFSSGTIMGTIAANTQNTQWALLNPAIPFDTDFVIAYLGPNTRFANSLQNFFNIARGTVGAETVFLSNLVHASDRFHAVVPYYLPISIPAGTRLTAKEQSSSTSDACALSLTLLSSGFAGIPPYGRISTHGAVVATTAGAVIDGGATANKKGAWTQVVASTSNPAKALIIAMTNGGIFLTEDAYYLVDVGIGPAGSEIILIPNLSFNVVSGPANVNPPTSGPWTVSIPAASRIAVRLQTTTTDSTNRKLHCLLYTLD